jgi:hypothetical protein
MQKFCQFYPYLDLLCISTKATEKKETSRDVIASQDNSGTEDVAVGVGDVELGGMVNV